MHIDSIRQWQWILFSLLVGLAIGYLREQAADDLAAQYGTQINSQPRFEQALLTLEQGRPCFTDIRVTSLTLPDRDGKLQDVSLVSGQYFNGHYEPTDGKLLARWDRAFFLAPKPYKPATDLLQRADAKLAARFAAITNPSVTDFLDALGPTGVRYSRAWWQGLRMWQWVILCFVTIGLLWPIALNLMLFGSWRRPRQEKGIDLSKVTLPPPTTAQPTITDDQIAQLESVTTDLEQQLAQAATPASEDHAPDEPTPVRELATSTISCDPDPHSPDTNFDAKPDDFYPTAKPTPPPRK